MLQSGSNLGKVVVRVAQVDADAPGTHFVSGG